MNTYEKQAYFPLAGYGAGFKIAYRVVVRMRSDHHA